MRSKDVIIGNIYGIKNNPYFFKPISILKPKQGVNKNSYIVVSGWFSSVEWSFDFAIKKHFRLHDLVPLKKQPKQR